MPQMFQPRVFCIAHDIEATAMVNAGLGRFIDFDLVGGGICDEHLKLVAEVFRKTVSKRAESLDSAQRRER